ncbi:MAG: hypothetical protein RMM30_02205 [Armatimonadota bacterium]|nr:hypothetical protein [Armatimonadota bacterium]MDW8155385.1 hypothetical protein [Armatimonadota bacterium]
MVVWSTVIVGLALLTPAAPEWALYAYPAARSSAAYPRGWQVRAGPVEESVVRYCGRLHGGIGSAPFVAPFARPPAHGAGTPALPLLSESPGTDSPCAGATLRRILRESQLVGG